MQKTRFFEEELSLEVSRCLLGVALKLARFDRHGGGKRLLLRAMSGLAKYLGKLRAQGSTELPGDLDIRWSDGIQSLDELRAAMRIVFTKADLWSNLAPKATKHIHQRLAQICRVMLDDARLKPSVADFFEELQRCRSWDAIVGIGEWLQDAPDFFFLDWLRRVLDSGDVERRQGKERAWLHDIAALRARRRCQDWLERELRFSEVHSVEVLEAIRHWLPAPGRDPAKYTLSECYAVVFPRLCGEQTAQKGGETAGASSRLGALLTARGETETPERLAAWITTPGLGHAVRVCWLDQICGHILPQQAQRFAWLDAVRSVLDGAPIEEDPGLWLDVLLESSRHFDPRLIAAQHLGMVLMLWTDALLAEEESPAALDWWERLVQGVAEKLPRDRRLWETVAVFLSEIANSIGRESSEAEPSEEGERKRKSLRAQHARISRLRALFLKTKPAAPVPTVGLEPTRP